jgi:hypothetical protein
MAKKYPDVFEDLPQETSDTKSKISDVPIGTQSDDADKALQDNLGNYADINSTLKEKLPLFQEMAKNQTQIINNQDTIQNSMSSLSDNQVKLEKQMKNFGISEAKRIEIQGKFDEMGIRSAGKFVDAVQDKCDRYIKRIESSGKAFIIPQVAGWCLIIIFLSLVTFFFLIVVTNIIAWKSRMVWEITGIVSGFMVTVITLILLVYNYFLKDKDERRY